MWPSLDNNYVKTSYDNKIYDLVENNNTITVSYNQPLKIHIEPDDCHQIKSDKVILDNNINRMRLLKLSSSQTINQGQLQFTQSNTPLSPRNENDECLHYLSSTTTHDYVNQLINEIPKIKQQQQHNNNNDENIYYLYAKPIKKQRQLSLTLKEFQNKASSQQSNSNHHPGLLTPSDSSHIQIKPERAQLVSTPISISSGMAVLSSIDSSSNIIVNNNNNNNNNNRKKKVTFLTEQTAQCSLNSDEIDLFIQSEHDRVERVKKNDEEKTQQQHSPAILTSSSSSSLSSTTAYTNPNYVHFNDCVIIPTTGDENDSNQLISSSFIV